MNLFLLDKDPELAAIYHHNKHVVKMITESGQILSTALQLSHHMLGDNFKHLYKPTHQNHPCILWCHEKHNFAWAVDLMDALIREYDYRYPLNKGKFLKARYLVENFKRVVQINWGILLPNPNWKTAALAMPEEYRVFTSGRFPKLDPIKSYRNYYVNAKIPNQSWGKRGEPFWLLEYGNI